MTASGTLIPGSSAFSRPLRSPSFDGLSFKDVDAFYERVSKSPEVSIVYYPEIDTHMGRNRVQIVITYQQ